jgi:hypothetical protein
MFFIYQLLRFPPTRSNTQSLFSSRHGTTSTSNLLIYFCYCNLINQNQSINEKFLLPVSYLGDVFTRNINLLNYSKIL